MQLQVFKLFLWMYMYILLFVELRQGEGIVEIFFNMTDYPILSTITTCEYSDATLKPWLLGRVSSRIIFVEP